MTTANNFKYYVKVIALYHFSHCFQHHDCSVCSLRLFRRLYHRLSLELWGYLIDQFLRQKCLL